MFKDWGYNKLGEYEYKESIDEMKHADLIIARILFLEGLPNVQDMHKVMIGEEPVECLKCDLGRYSNEKTTIFSPNTFFLSPCGDIFLPVVAVSQLATSL